MDFLLAVEVVGASQDILAQIVNSLMLRVIIMEYQVSLAYVLAMLDLLVHTAMFVSLDITEVIVNHVLEELQIHVVDMGLVIKEFTEVEDAPVNYFGSVILVIKLWLAINTDFHA